MSADVIELFEIFARGLGHQIRTPLSVVINDLTYLNTLYPDADCQRSVGRAREIAGILSELKPESGEIENFNILKTRDFLVWSKINPVKSVETCCSQELVVPRLAQVFKIFNLLMEKNFKVTEYSADILPDQVKVVVSFADIQFNKLVSEHKFTSLNQFFQKYFAKEDSLIALFDLLHFGLPIESVIEVDFSKSFSLLWSVKFMQKPKVLNA